jgi:hypothetical protein
VTDTCDHRWHWHDERDLWWCHRCRAAMFDDDVGDPPDLPPTEGETQSNNEGNTQK